MKNTFKFLTAGMLIALSLISQAASYERPNWNEPKPERFGWITAEFVLPQFVSGYSRDISATAGFIKFDIPSSSGSNIVIDIPWSRVAYDQPEFYIFDDGWQGGPNTRKPDGALGNIYLGIETPGRDSDFVSEAGLRLPTGGNIENYTVVDALQSATNRWGAFGRSFFVFTFATSYRHRSASGFVTNFRISPVLTVGADGFTPYFASSRLFIQYAYRVGLEKPGYAFLAGIEGTFEVRQSRNEEFDWGKRTTHRLTTSVSYTIGRIRPSLMVQIPLDKDLKEVFNSVIGLSISYQVKLKDRD